MVVSGVDEGLLLEQLSEIPILRWLQLDSVQLADMRQDWVIWQDGGSSVESRLW